jgi:hypothetical protein
MSMVPQPNIDQIQQAPSLDTNLTFELHLKLLLNEYFIQEESL